MPQFRTLAAYLLKPAGFGFAFVVSFAIIVAIQVQIGCYASEFGAHSDEPAHVVTGLMVHDYLLGGNWAEPTRFAENYYLHYPKVGLGHWPPVFYVLQAGWMAIFGVSVRSLLLLMACLCAALSAMLFRVSYQHVGAPAAVVAAVTFLLLPTVGKFSGLIMTEMLVTLLSFAATLAFARYMSAEGAGRWRWSCGFGLLAALAILTKGTGLLLAFVPPIALLLAGRVSYFRRPSLWLSAIVVAVTCAPFYILTLKMQQNGMQHESFMLSFVPVAAQFYSDGLVQTSTAVVFVLALIGFADRVMWPGWRNTRPEPVFATLAALLLSTWGFHTLVPCGLESRHLLPAIPPVMVFAAAGLHRLASWFGQKLALTSTAVAVALGLLVVLFVVLWNTPYRKDWRGYREVAETLQKREDGASVLTLISSDPQGEGMLVSEMALADGRRPSRYVLRASKVLASDRWSGRDYRTRFGSLEELRTYIRGCSIGGLVIDTSLTPENMTEHHRQLVHLVAAFPQEWQLETRHDLIRDGVRYSGVIHLYRPVHFHPTFGEIGINMEAMLGRTIRTVRHPE